MISQMIRLVSTRTWLPVPLIVLATVIGLWHGMVLAFAGGQVIWSHPWIIMTVDISPDGQRLLVGVRQDDGQNSYLLNVVDQKASLVAPGLIGGVWSPDGDQIAFSGLWVAQADGQELRQLDQGGYAASWSPDGQYLAYLKTGTGQSDSLQVVDLSTGTPREILSDQGLLIARPLWSPDGWDLVYSVGFIGGSWYLTGLEGEKQTKLTGEHIAYGAAWSPDGQWIAYAADDGIWIVDREGRNRRSVATVGQEPAWSSDGHWILYQTRSPEGAEPILLWKVGRDGQDRQQIGPLEGLVANSVLWSPQHNQALVLSKPGVDYTIEVLSW